MRITPAWPKSTSTVPRPRAVSARPCVDCLDQPPATRTGRLTAPRRAAFWLVAGIFTTTMLGTTLPTPLYGIYQAQWHFSSALVTVIFAVYAAAVMAPLLLAGRSSDQAGRRPVLAVALGASALSTVVFILAPDVGALIAARIVSGLSAGLMTGTATATLTELAPAGAHRRASLVATVGTIGGLGPGPAARPRDRAPPPPARTALRRARHTVTGPRPVHRRRAGRLRRLRP